MAKSVMLAVAGAGKTYHICRSIDKKKKNLILAYTHENIKNINKELIDAYGKIPDLTNVMTFHSFLYRYVLCPLEPMIVDFFGIENFKRIGITMKKPPSSSIIKNKRRIPNKYYHKKNSFFHYVCNNEYYCSNMAELILYIKGNGVSLINKMVEYINIFYDQVCIDEFQDFRNYEYELIVSVASKLNNVIMVGDYYQHSVSAKNNSGKPFKSISENEYIELLKGEGLDVDPDSLMKTRRCPQAICEFVEKKLEIKIGCANDNQGNIIWVNDEIINRVLQDDSIVKLTWNNSAKYTFNSCNWSYSKGDTYDSICIIMTETINNLDNPDFDVSTLPEVTRNKLYVAITRTKGNLYFVKKEDFEKVKNNYLKQTTS